MLSVAGSCHWSARSMVGWIEGLHSCHTVHYSRSTVLFAVLCTLFSACYYVFKIDKPQMFDRLWMFPLMFNTLHRKLLAGTPIFGHHVHSWFWNSSSSPATSKTADPAREAEQAVRGKRHRGNEFCHRLAVWIAPPLDQGGQLREQLRLWGLQQWWLAGYSR